MYEKLFIVFDEGKQTFRNRIDSSYKAQRKRTPESIINHIIRIQNLLIDNNIYYLTDINFEADDLIASFIKKFSSDKSCEFHILSQDKDLFQLLSENVFLLRYKENRLDKFGSQEFLEMNGFSHENFVYYLALKGDKVDNIKGVKGIGEKKAAYLTTNFHNLENTFKKIEIIPTKVRKLIEDQKELIEQNISMISLVNDLQIDE